MIGFRYYITVSDKENNVKRKEKGMYFIKFLQLGRGAILIKDDESGIQTSKVEEISIWDNDITITTRNSVYRLELA